MATFRQVLANRANAQKSTGPKTVEGKLRSRANALTHGLSGAGIVLAEAEAAEVHERSKLWAAELRPTSGRQRWLVEQAAVESLRVDRCQRHESALRAIEAGRAATSWEADRRLEAEDLGETLAKKPSKVARKLASTRQGCDWLATRWEGLAATIRVGGDWDDAAQELALDLLGIPPELRKGPTPIDGDAPARRAVAVAEIARLHALRADGLDDLDAFEREAAEEGLAVSFSRPMTLLLRYERASSRLVFRALHEIHKAQKSAGAARLDDEEDDRDDTAAEPFARAPEPPAPRPEPAPIPAPAPSAIRPATPIVPVSAALATPRPVSLAGALRSQVVKAPPKLNRRARRALLAKS